MSTTLTVSMYAFALAASNYLFMILANLQIYNNKCPDCRYYKNFVVERVDESLSMIIYSKCAHLHFDLHPQYLRYMRVLANWPQLPPNIFKEHNCLSRS